MRGICFISGSPGVTYEHRVVHAAQACESLGLRAKLYEPRSDGDHDLNSIVQQLESGRIIAVVCHRVPLSPSLLEIARRCQVAQAEMIYDADDLIFDLEFARLFERLKISSRQVLEGKVKASVGAIQLFQHAWCSTPAIARGLTRLGVHDVTVVPNTFSEEARVTADLILRNRSQNAKADSSVVIGFGSGSGTHAIDLEVVAVPLARVLQQFKFTRLCLIGWEAIPKVLQSYHDQIQHFQPVPYSNLLGVMGDWDINIAPLERSNFTEAKSPLKYIDAALVEIPTVATPTEPFASAIRDGVTGRLANTEQEWYDLLRDLVVNSTQRRVLGRAARVDVLERFGPSTKRHSIQQALATLHDGIVSDKAAGEE